MRLIDADALKAHYAWLGENASDEDKEDERSAYHWKIVFDQIVDAQPTISSDAGMQGNEKAQKMAK